MGLPNILPSAYRFSLRPGLIALATVQVLALACQLPGALNLYLIPLTLLGYLTGAVVVLAVTIRLLVKRHLQGAVSVFQIVLLPVLLWLPINRVAEVIHLALTVKFGIGQLGHVAAPADGGFAVYDWSVGLAGGPNTFLLRDETDDISFPLSAHRHAPSFDDELEKDCSGNSRRLLHHYDLCSF